MKREAAEEICKLLIRIGQELDRSVARVRELEGESDEYKRYRRVVGGLMADIFTEALKPRFSEYPDLKPPELE